MVWPPSRIAFVLVEPTEPGNIGSVCRALCNFGFTPAQLTLANCRCDPQSPKAHARAGQAHSWLAQLRRVPTLDAALAGASRVVGTTGGIDPIRQQACRPPREAMPALLARSAAAEAAGEGGVALLFGTEATGLSHPQLLRCDELIQAPTDRGYSALNLAVAVSLMAYELRCAHLAAQPPVPAEPVPIPQRPADAALMDLLCDRLFLACERVGYFNPQNPLPLRHALRQILGRSELSRQEAQLLLGLARQILWFSEGGRSRWAVAQQATAEPPTGPILSENVSPEA